jgi:hypothetical protein
MQVRRTLQFGLLALVATMVLTVLWNIGLGVGEPLWNSGLNVDREPMLGETIVSYLRWGGRTSPPFSCSQPC